MSILIVDDQAINTRLMQTMLQRAGFHDVITASSGEQALEILCSAKDGNPANIELILLDIMMPGMNGIDVVKVIRRHEQFSRLPVIMATAVDEEASLDAAFAAGATDYLTKPFRPIEIRARVTSALAMSKEIREREGREKQLHEITLKLEEANRTLQLQSTLDGLTGIANRRHFNETLEREMRRARRTTMESGEPSQVAVIMVDIDYFKQFNDTYGHVAGDDTLRAVSASLKRCMRRPGDMVARFGGEEFACILPDTDIDGARKVAEQMRRRIEWLDIPHERSQVGKNLTASIGVSAGVGLDEKQIVRLADDALYDAKHEGRNRVCQRVPKPSTESLPIAAVA